MQRATPHSAKGPWNKSLNFIFPIKYVTPKSLKVGHWLSEPLEAQKMQIQDLNEESVKCCRQ